MTIPSFVIGIAGGTGAGKTTVAREVADTVGEAITRVPLDNYYEDLSHLPYEERAAVNYDHPSAFEWSLLREHLETLLLGQSVEMPRYDFERHVREDETVTVDPTDVIVLEGIFALYDDDVREMLDLHVYVMTDADVRILRRIERDVVERGRDLEGVIEQYRETVKPMHERFVAPTRKHADVIIPEGANRMAVDLLTEKVAAELDRDRRAGFVDGGASSDGIGDASRDGSAERTTVEPERGDGSGSDGGFDDGLDDEHGVGFGDASNRDG